MSIQKIQKFSVIGIAVKTTNQNGQASKDLEILWGKFWNEEIQKQIPNKISDDIYAVYTDYESDHTGTYTAIIGQKVSTLENIPNGFTGKIVETAHYEKFISKGKMPEAIISTWYEIWQNKNLKRIYKADFTIHGEKYDNGDQAEVETFISVENM